MVSGFWAAETEKPETLKTLSPLPCRWAAIKVVGFEATI
jgi:hypothetical protein